MARIPFKLRSGNSTPFKQMGGSPVKQTYSEAYAGLGEKEKAEKSEAEFIAEAEAWWKTDAGQEKAKSDPKFKHRIIKKDVSTTGEEADSLEGMTNSQGDKIIRDGEWVDIDEDEANKRLEEGLEKGELIERETSEGKPAVDVVNKTNVESNSTMSSEEAIGRAKDRIKLARKEFGRRSPEVKAAKASLKAAKIDRKAKHEAKIAANPELESWWNRSPKTASSMFGTGSPKDMSTITAQWKEDTVAVRAARDQYGRGSDEVKAAKRIRRYNQQTLFGENQTS